MLFVTRRLKPHCEASNALKKWHIAYHGTSAGALRRTLDHNQLLPGMKKRPNATLPPPRERLEPPAPDAAVTALP